MKKAQQTITVTIASVLMGAFVSLLVDFGSTIRADDTDIYFADLANPSVEEDVAANVLFMLDTSGSMGGEDGTGTTRLERMKQALGDIIGNSAGINIGLGRFHPEMGAPIVSPIAYIDGDATDILGAGGTGTQGGGTNPLSFIEANSDDAEENMTTNAVVIDRTTLKTPRTGTSLAVPSPTTSTFSLPAGVDDAQEAPGSSNWDWGCQCVITEPGTMYLNELSLALGAGVGGNDMVGLRFPNVTIPQGATILDAKITLTVAATPSTGDTDLIITGHDADDAEDFSVTAIAPRNRTNATVNWSNVFDQAAGTDLTSPQLRTIVQEIVDRPGWGGNNGMAFIVEGSGARDVNSVEGGGATSLVVTYVQGVVGIELQVQSDNDDAEELSTGMVTRGSNTLEVVEYTGTQQICEDVYEARCDFGQTWLDFPTPADAQAYAAACNTYRGRCDSTQAWTDFFDADACASAINDVTCGGPPTAVESRCDWDQEWTPYAGALIECQAASADGSLCTPIVAVESRCDNADDWVDYAGTLDECQSQIAGICGDPITTYSCNSGWCGGTINDQNNPDDNSCMRWDWGVDSCVLDPTNYSSNTTNDNPSCQIASITNDNPQCRELDLGRTCENAYEPQSRTRQNCWNEPYTGEQTVGLRFQSAAIPENATILWADLELTVDVENTAQADVVIHGEGSANSVQFQSTLDNISSRTTTTSSVTWNDMLAPAANETLISPNLAPVVQEIVDLGGWAEGNALTVMLTDDPSVDNIADRLIRSHDDSSTRAPRLRVWFAEGAGDAQTVGLRFSDVGVPQGAQIESAFLEFRVAQSTQEPSDITIHGELNVAPATFTTAPGDISSRATTLASVSWNSASDPPLGPWNNVGEVQQSPDVSTIVQEIVNETDWCGGNPMAFILSGDTGRRIASSFDNDPSLAPVLRVNFTTPDGAGCGKVSTITQISSGGDDITESATTGSITAGSADLDIVQRHVGLRFRNVSVPNGATIVDAYLEFEADENDGLNVANTSIYGELTPDAAPYTTASYSLTTGRTYTSAVAWNDISDWNDGAPYRTPSLTAMVQQIVDQTDWASSQAMAFWLAQDDSWCADWDGGDCDSIRDRSACSYEAGCAAPKLVIEYQFGGGEDPGGGSGTTIAVRDVMLDTINQFQPNGWTPVVDALYEAALYYKGQDVYWGRTRGAGPDYDGSNADNALLNGAEFSRLSHPATYTDADTATIVRDGQCTVTNPQHRDCRTERLTSAPHTYIQPESGSCRPSFLVLLSDGQANRNHSEALIESMIGSGCTAQITLENGSGMRAPSQGERCGVDLARHLYENDHWDLVGGKNNIKTFTIGFNLTGTQGTAAREFLREVADAGGGQFFEASSAAELTAVFETILSVVREEVGSFTMPSLSLNVFNRLVHNDTVFLSVFGPSPKQRWMGNVKKFRLCTATDGSCTPGEVLDANYASAVITDPTDPNFGNLNPNARGLWSGPSDDALDVTDGGAGEKTPAHTARRVYWSDGATLRAIDRDFELANTDTLLKTVLHAEGNCDAAGAPDNDCLNALIEWMLGKTGTNPDEPRGVDALHRWAWSDALHSDPQVLPFGGTESDPIQKVLIGSNGGGLHLINELTGVEEWVIYPRATLDMQETLMSYVDGDHLYGVDTRPTARIKDVDGDGVIEPGDGDFVHAYVAMRRGGNSVFAFDLTPDADAGLTDATATDGITPEKLWSIEGGVTPGFGQLAQSWSTPKVVRINANTVLDDGTVAVRPRTVLIFGGGYDPGQDNGFGADAVGNAVYIVDADTGQRLWSASGPGNCEGMNNCLELPGMTFSIPANVTTIDSDPDDGRSFTDQLYLVDVGGQVWRIDLASNLADSTGGRLAALSTDETTGGPPSAADQRKFFYAPSVAKVSGDAFSATTEHNLVVVISGNRADPLGTATDDRAYGIRDFQIGERITLNVDGTPENYPLCNGQTLCNTPLNHGDLLDVTDLVIVDPNTADPVLAAAVQELAGAHGWYFNLATPGEKGWARASILEDAVFFTVYVPGSSEQSAQSCTIEPGYSRLYGIDALTGAPIFPEWEGDITLTTADRFRYLGTGPTAEASPAYLDSGPVILVPTGGGALAQDPDISTEIERTFWYE